MLVEAPAPSPGEQYLFWYAALRTAATRSKITDNRKKRSPPARAAISHLLQTGQAAKRNLALAKEIKQLQESEDNLLKQKSEGKQKETAQTQIIPVAQHILESYPILSLEERNRLWKLVLKKATIYRSPDNEVTIRIYPNIPK